MPRELDPAEGNWIWSESESDLLQTRTGHDLYEAASEAFAAIYANDPCVIPQSWRGTPTRYASNGVPAGKPVEVVLRHDSGWAGLGPFHPSSSSSLSHSSFISLHVFPPVYPFFVYAWKPENIDLRLPFAGQISPHVPACLQQCIFIYLQFFFLIFSFLKPMFQFLFSCPSGNMLQLFPTGQLTLAVDE